MEEEEEKAGIGCRQRWGPGLATGSGSINALMGPHALDSPVIHRCQQSPTTHSFNESTRNKRQSTIDDRDLFNRSAGWCVCAEEAEGHDISRRRYEVLPIMRPSAACSQVTMDGDGGVPQEVERTTNTGVSCTSGGREYRT